MSPASSKKRVPQFPFLLYNTIKIVY